MNQHARNGEAKATKQSPPLSTELLSEASISVPVDINRRRSNDAAAVLVAEYVGPLQLIAALLSCLQFFVTCLVLRILAVSTLPRTMPDLSASLLRRGLKVSHALWTRLWRDPEFGSVCVGISILL